MFTLLLILLSSMLGCRLISGYHIAHHPAEAADTEHVIGGRVYYLLNNGARARVIPDKITLEHFKYVHLMGRIRKAISIGLAAVNACIHVCVCHMSVS